LKIKQNPKGLAGLTLPVLARFPSMGEGNTPLVEIDKGLYAKLDYMMPTLSFKDRGAAVLMAAALEMGVKHVIQDSSGNAGCSIAAYAARAGIKADIYIGESTPPRKIKMIEDYGANVIVIRGTREDVAAAALKEVAKGEKFYASHVYNPLFAQGMKSYIFEVFQQMDGELPDNIFVPLGNGTLFYGVYHGINDLIQQGKVNKFPKIIAIQASGCAPVYESYNTWLNSKSGDKSVTPTPVLIPVINKGTVADGIAIANPANGNDILKKIVEIDAAVVTVTDLEIEQAYHTLARKGFHVEMTSAANYAGYKKYIPAENYESGSSGRPVNLITLCGATK
jgi:threonine synthase